MKQQKVVAAKPLDKNGPNWNDNIIGLNNEGFASYHVFYNEVHYKKIWIPSKVIVLPLPFWLWTSNETQRSFGIYNNPSTGAASECSLGKEKPKCCHLGHHGFVWIEGHIFLTTCPIQLKFGLWTDFRQVWAQAKFQLNRMKNGGDRGVLHLMFTIEMEGGILWLCQKFIISHNELHYRRHHMKQNPH